MMRIFFISFLFFMAPAFAAAPVDPIWIQANEMTYLEGEEILIIEGDVKLAKQDPKTNQWRILLADKVRYKKKEKIMEASGNVRIQEPSGDVIYINEGELSDDFQEGLLEGLYILTKDEARFSAKKGKKLSQKTRLTDGTYSPCSLCKADAMEAPLWQVRAQEITHDEESKTVFYKNARLEMKGIPVAYFPYFSHPDPSVKRKSGLLSPTFKVSKDFGFVVSQPVYYSIAPNRDLILTPMFLQKQNPVLAGGYRHRFFNGEMRGTASYTKTKNLQGPFYGPWNGPRPPHPDRWNITAFTEYHVTDNQRITLDANRASDTTYLSRYPIQNQMPSFVQNRSLTSKAVYEYFGQNRYFSTKGYAFQTDNPKTTPVVLPKAYYHQQTEPQKIGGLLTLEGGVLSLQRQTPVLGRVGTQTERATSGANWKRPWFLNSGHVLTLQTSVRGDAYYTRRYYVSTSPTMQSLKNTVKTTGRVFPQGALEWKYPLIRPFSQTNWIMEPKAMVSASPQWLNNLHIPNEDSNTFELDETSLFLMNRFHGIDRVDTGQRAVYGVENAFQFPKQRSVSFFLGQDRRLDHKNVIGKNLGEDQNQSDYIARLKVQPASWFATRYRVALTPQRLRPRYSEWGTIVGEKKLQLDVGFMHLDKTANLLNQNISQANWQLKSQVNDNWNLSVAQIRNLNRLKTHASLANFLAATYQDECFKMDVGVYQTKTQDRDIRPDSGFLVQFSFKNLGGFTPSTTPSYPGTMLTHIQNQP